MSKKLITYDAIGNLYDPTLKDKENLKIMKDNGVDVCLRTLQNFKKDSGISKTQQKRRSEARLLKFMKIFLRNFSQHSSRIKAMVKLIHSVRDGFTL